MKVRGSAEEEHQNEQQIYGPVAVFHYENDSHMNYTHKRTVSSGQNAIPVDGALIAFQSEIFWNILVHYTQSFSFRDVSRGVSADDRCES